MNVPGRSQSTLFFGQRKCRSERLVVQSAVGSEVFRRPNVSVRTLQRDRDTNWDREHGSWFFPGGDATKRNPACHVASFGRELSTCSCFDGQEWPLLERPPQPPINLLVLNHDIGSQGTSLGSLHRTTISKFQELPCLDLRTSVRNFACVKTRLAKGSEKKPRAQSDSTNFLGIQRSGILFLWSYLPKTHRTNREARKCPTLSRAETALFFFFPAKKLA